MENNYYFHYFFGVATEKKVHAKVCFFILPNELCMHLIDTCNLFLVCLVDIQFIKFSQEVLFNIKLKLYKNFTFQLNLLLQY